MPVIVTAAAKINKESKGRTQTTWHAQASYSPTQKLMKSKIEKTH